jgi:hypothetical protein
MQVDLLQRNESVGAAVEADISTKFLAYCVSTGSYMVRDYPELIANDLSSL